METTLLIFGLVCLISAVIGGGLKARGIEIPVVDSVPRQVVLFFLGVILVGVSLLVDGGVPRGGSPLPTSSEPGTAPARTGQSAPQSRSGLSPAQVSQITGIRLPGRPVAPGDQYLPQSEVMKTFQLIAAQRGMTVDRVESFQWAELDGTEAHQIRDGLLRELQQAGYGYQRLMRPEGQSSFAESEIFALQRREQYIVGFWSVGAYGREKNNLRSVVVWSWALLQ